jgi:hypothetical protein
LVLEVLAHRTRLSLTSRRMTWPILIAGFEIPKDDQTRKTAVELLGEFEWVPAPNFHLTELFPLIRIQTPRVLR